jgi:hypothetical protein
VWDVQTELMMKLMRTASYVAEIQPQVVQMTGAG